MNPPPDWCLIAAEAEGLLVQQEWAAREDGAGVEHTQVDV